MMNNVNVKCFELPLKVFCKSFPKLAMQLRYKSRCRCMEEMKSDDNYIIRFNGIGCEIGYRSDDWEMFNYE